MSDGTITLEILGNPKPQGRPRACVRGRHAAVYEDKKDRQAKNTIAVVVQDMAPDKPLSGPLKVDLTFYMPRPKSHYRTGRYAGMLKDNAPTLHTKRPDIDNLRKLVMDALTGIFWVDDSQVCEGLTKKIYSDKPRTNITIATLSERCNHVKLKEKQKLKSTYPINTG